MHPWKWLATALAILASTFRAFNWGYQKESYMVTFAVQITFAYGCWKNKDQQGLILNIFYIFTSFIGMYRWMNNS